MIQIFTASKKQLMTIGLIVGFLFIYGCQCEGGIGTSSEVVNIVTTSAIQPENK